MYAIVQWYANPATREHGVWEMELLAVCLDREVAEKWAEDNAPERADLVFRVVAVEALNADSVDARESLKGFALDRFLRCSFCGGPA